MKIHKKFLAWLLAMLCIMNFAVLASAEGEDDTDYEPEITTTAVPDTAAPHGTLTPETTTAPAKETTTLAVDPPFVSITRERLPHEPKAGELFTLTIVVHNYSNQVSLINGTLSVEESEGLVLAEKSASKVISSLDRGDVRNVPVKFRVSNSAATSKQTVSVTYTYSYRTPDGLKEGQATEKLIVPVKGSGGGASSSKNATPNIIVSKYSYGDKIAAGDAFVLELQFRNTSGKLAAENIVMSVETGDGLSITSASNTYYFAKLGANQTKSQRIPMRVSANAGSEGTRIDISFHYEYVDNGERGEASASEKLSVPIYLPDRFTVTPPEMDAIGVQNEEMTISLPYVNKSRTGVDNVSAELIYDENAVYCEQSRVLLGNIEPGKNGTIDFFFTPLESGSASVQVKITYENELVEEKTMELTVPFSADPAMDMPMSEEPIVEEPTEEKTNTGLYIAIAVGALLLAVVVIVLLVRKKKKKAAQIAPQFDWSISDSETQVNANENR